MSASPIPTFSKVTIGDKNASRGSQIGTGEILDNTLYSQREYGTEEDEELVEHVVTETRRKRTLLSHDEYIRLSRVAKDSPLGLHMYRFDSGFTDEITPEMVTYGAGTFINSRPDILMYALTTGGKWSVDKYWLTELVIRYHSDTRTYDVIRYLAERDLLFSNACEYAAKGHLSALEFLHNVLGFPMTPQTAYNAAGSGKVDCLDFAILHGALDAHPNTRVKRRFTMRCAIENGHINCVEHLRTRFPDDPWPSHRDFIVPDLRMYMYLIEHGFTDVPLPNA